MYDIAKKVCHDQGMPWTDPRTGITHQPPEKEQAIDVVRKELKAKLDEAEAEYNNIIGETYWIEHGGNELVVLAGMVLEYRTDLSSKLTGVDLQNAACDALAKTKGEPDVPHTPA